MNIRVISYLVALALIFSACEKEIELAEAIATDDVNANGKDSSTGIRQNSLETEYIVSYSGLANVVINGQSEYVTQFLLTDDDENVLYAFCADMNNPCYEGATYQLVSAGDYLKNGEEIKIMAALTYIANEYGWMETDNPEGYMLLIQCVLWRIIHDCEVDYVYNIDGEMIKEVIDYIYDNIDNLPQKDYNTVVIMEGEDTAAEDGDFVNYGPYNISENALLTDVYFDLKFEQGEDKAIFVDETGIEITRAKPGETFYISVPADAYGDFEFTATAIVTNDVWYVNDFQLFNDVREGENKYQPLFQPIKSAGTETYYYSCGGNFYVEQEEPDETIETITLSNLSWNNGNTSDKDGANGAGINSFDVNGITLKSNKNYVTPANFDAAVAKTPGKNDVAAIFTVTERTVTNNGKYEKVYEIKVAFYKDGEWIVYVGTITVDNPGGNDKNQNFELERY